MHAVRTQSDCFHRQMDLMTMALFNAKERTEAEYSALFQQASESLVLKNKYQVPHDPRSCIFEAVYETYG